MHGLILAVIGFSLIVVMTLVRIYKNQIKKNKIKRWSQSLNLEHHAEVFKNLFSRTDGFLLSRQARQEGDAFDYTYGEIEFFSFIALIALTHPDENTQFYDLGSGIGKATIACAMVFDLKKSCGIELFTNLYEAALELKKDLEQIPGYEHSTKYIEFIHDDFLKVDLSEATLIFINSTAFIGELWEKISQKLAEVAVGATIITISKKLSSNAFVVKRTTLVNMSWGIATAYIQEHQYQPHDLEL